ncbi:MAG: ABC transporter, partial [Coriobacteriia bacterium]|nr:ABC transporter [Coriobacteriia bacterium]
SDNTFTLEVGRVSDSRFERMVMLKIPGTENYLQWRVDRLVNPLDEAPKRGERLCIRIPEDRISLVTR